MAKVYLYYDSDYDIALDLYAAKSFFVYIYNSGFEELKVFQVPVSVAAPFANRLFRKIPALKGRKVREPWYSLEPGENPEFRRSELPAGHASLYGGFYDPIKQPAPKVRLHPEAKVSHFLVRLFDFQTELYKGVYTVDDIFLHGANYILHQGIKKGQIPDGEAPYYYAVFPSPKAMSYAPTEAFPEDAYEYNIEGVFRLPPRAREEKRIIFKPIPEPPLPEWDSQSPALASEKSGKGVSDPGRIRIPDHIYRILKKDLRLSSRIEEGGYLLGNVYRPPGGPEREDDPDFRWIVEITDILMAEDTIGSPARLLFTGDSWSKISRQIAQRRGERKLVGWFHTHVFPASDTFGLSGMDQNMHAWYLPRPWQIAVLLNLEKEGDRTVRCYQKGPDGYLEESEFEITGLQDPESGEEAV